MRRRQTLCFGFIIFLTICIFSLMRIPAGQVPGVDFFPDSEASEKQEETSGDRRHRQPVDKRPKAVLGPESHPIWYLLTEAEQNFEKLKAKQSKTLKDAVAEYKRRYNMPPPPHFDKWYEFAVANDVQMIDEFDMIYDMITPFWGLEPKTIRRRAKEALGHDNNLLMLQIRDKHVTHIQGAHSWQREATSGMMSKFVEYLPAMDLAFNIHDEPRVVVPHEDLIRLVKKAKEVNMPHSNKGDLKNDFSPKAKGLNAGHGMEDFKLTRFNVYAHQATWTNSRMSCPPDSPARTLEDDGHVDDISKYGMSELGFIYNVTAVSDICLSPSLADTYGFFDRPNAYNVVHDLFPIFSQSKISSYNDLIYPSPWYWYGKVEYDESHDKPWEKKRDTLYWRGSTTGGFSRDGGWRRQHRQNLVKKINAKGNALIYENEGTDVEPVWKTKEVPRGDHKDLIDVHFSHIGQCDPGDCDAQSQFFDIRTRADQQDAWKFKYLLDMDGNAFSGRFYAFLRSKSLTFKYAVFREWHFEWIKPWVHYVPLSLQGDDWLESVRFFATQDDSSGAGDGERLAMASRDWAGKVLRKEDMEAWFFRLLLEYGRVVDDNRENIGFSFDPAKDEPTDTAEGGKQQQEEEKST